MPDDGALLFIDVLAGNTSVVHIDDIFSLLEAARRFLPEHKGFLQSPLDGNIHPEIDICLSASLMDVFL